VVVVVLGAAAAAAVLLPAAELLLPFAGFSAESDSDESELSSDELL
jgi:hypothetical protein